MNQFCKALNELSDDCCRGLQALGSNSSKIKPADTRKITGSIDLDRRLQPTYPNDPRWDYGIGYQIDDDVEAAFWIEVHPACTSNVAEVINKLHWLKEFLKNHPLLQDLTKHTEKPYRWVATGRISISPNAGYARLLTQQGLGLPENPIRIP